MNHLICGPPGSGKTTYVKQHMQPGDIVVDLDYLCSAMTFTPLHSRPDELDVTQRFVVDVRDLIIDMISRRFVTAWIIGCYSDRLERERIARQINAEIIVLDVPESICLDRIRNDKDRPRDVDWAGAVRKWWKIYESTSVTP